MDPDQIWAHNVCKNTFNPLVPNHRKHCPKTFILHTVTYFGKYITKLHLKCLGGQRSRRYICIIYDTLGIKCSQAKMNNSRIKTLFRIYLCLQYLHLLKRFFWKIYIKFFSKKVAGRGIFHFEQKFCPAYHV